jgi:hypothetical protein
MPGGKKNKLNPSNKVKQESKKEKHTTDIVWWWSPSAHESVLGGSPP